MSFQNLMDWFRCRDNVSVNEKGWIGWDSWDLDRCVSLGWFPGIPIYHSRDLKNWELYTHVLNDDEAVDLKKLPSAKGIWAPCLTYCEEEDMFYVVYGVMNSMNARYFDVDNYLIKSKDIKGPWSKPVYLHSAGFDASILHDKNGKTILFLWNGKLEKAMKNQE